MTEKRGARTIVAADADPHIRSTLKAFLGDRSDVLPPFWAEDARRALQLCREIRPDILLTEIRLPEGDGLTLARLLRREQPNLRVLFLTDVQDFSAARAAVQMGASGYLLKPIREEELSQALDTAAGTEESLQDVRETSGPDPEKEEERAEDIRRVLENKSAGAQRNLAGAELLWEIARTRAKSGNPISPERQVHLLRRVLEEKTTAGLERTILDALKGKEKVKHPRAGAVAAEAEGIIEREYMHSGLTVQAIAREMSLSPNYLSGAYREETGKRLGDTLSRVRMERAAEMLRETDLTLEEIAVAVGFENVRYFASVYLRRRGEHPLETRDRKE